MMNGPCFSPILAMFALALSAAFAHAGGGPETTLLVVNARSPASLQVANTYIALRQLPDHHVVWLEGVPTGDTIDVATFRKQILEPVRLHLEHTGLEHEIDLIAYSAGFPYAVNFRKDEAAHGLEPDKLRGDAAAITGLTYFGRKVAAGRIDYLETDANHYARRPLGVPVSAMARRAQGSTGAAKAVFSGVEFEAARGFRSRYLWGRTASGRGMDITDRYWLSVMLGYTGRRGNSVTEIERYLNRAARSDGTLPEGTVYLLENHDIRTRVRRDLFDPAIEALHARGRRAAILKVGRDGQNGREPRGKEDVIGLVAGTRTFDWASSGSAFLPGAIAESFTSYGAHFSHAPQTKLSAFLRHGAAGSSGAVREPYAVVQKFPLPQLHVHYADGVSLAEAFFLSVLSPYQLLVVGDPLAQPFARFARVSLDEPDEETVWRGRMRLRPRVMAAEGRPVERVEFWIDGQKRGEVEPGEVFEFDTSGEDDGTHDLRIVAVEAGLVETRSHLRRAVRVDNRGRSVAISAGPPSAGFGEALVVEGFADGANRIGLSHAGRVVASGPVKDGRWSLGVDTRRLGLGEVALTATAEWPEGHRARSAAHQFRVTLPALMSPETASDPPPGNEGLQVFAERAGATSRSAHIKGMAGWLPRELNAARADRVVFVGLFSTRADGLYELEVETPGEVTLHVGGGAVRPVSADGRRFVLPLAAGWHRFELAISGARSNRFHAVLSGPEPGFELDGSRVRLP